MVEGDCIIPSELWTEMKPSLVLKIFPGAPFRQAQFSDFNVFL